MQHVHARTVYFQLALHPHAICTSLSSARGLNLKTLGHRGKSYIECLGAATLFKCEAEKMALSVVMVEMRPGEALIAPPEAPVFNGGTEAGGDDSDPRRLHHHITSQRVSLRPDALGRFID